jgi:hypothetical protein
VRLRRGYFFCGRLAQLLRYSLRQEVLELFMAPYQDFNWRKNNMYRLCDGLKPFAKFLYSRLSEILINRNGFSNTLNHFRGISDVRRALICHGTTQSSLLILGLSIWIVSYSP